MTEEFDVEKRRQELQHRKAWIEKGLDVANRFVQNKTEELREIEEQLDLLDMPLLDPNENRAKAVIPAELLATPEMDIASISSSFKGTARRGAMTKKEKEELVDYAKKKKEEERSDAAAQPGTQPNKPGRPTDKAQQPWKLMTPSEKKNFVTQKLKQKDPRQQKEAIDLLKKPENKPFLEEFMKDKEFEKTYKNAETMVGKYEKIKTSLRKNLKTMMRSSSDVVKLQISKLRAGKVGSAIVGMKELSNAVNFDNEVGRAAGSVVKGVQELYKMFDIKPEEALNKELLEEARPVFTHQMAEKGRTDREIDLKSRQNKVWGETRELTDEEREALARISKETGSDKLPSVNKKEDMALVKDILVETAKASDKKVPIPAILAAKSTTK